MDQLHGLCKFAARVLGDHPLGRLSDELAKYATECVDDNGIRIILGSRIFRGVREGTVEFYWIDPTLGAKARYALYEKYKDKIAGKIYFSARSNVLSNHSTNIVGNVYRID